MAILSMGSRLYQSGARRSATADQRCPMNCRALVVSLLTLSEPKHRIQHSQLGLKGVCTLTRMSSVVGFTFTRRFASGQSGGVWVWM